MNPIVAILSFILFLAMVIVIGPLIRDTARYTVSLVKRVIRWAAEKWRKRKDARNNAPNHNVTASPGPVRRSLLHRIRGQFKKVKE